MLYVIGYLEIQIKVHVHKERFCISFGHTFMLKYSQYNMFVMIWNTCTLLSQHEQFIFYKYALFAYQKMQHFKK